jgi:glycosyltransferase involved in cell wall biosynthesis
MKCLQFLLANYNSAEHIEILIKSLRTYHPGFSYEILVCDNGSKDGSDEYLESLPEVRMWHLDERAPDTDYNHRQQAVIDKYELEPYLNDYFRQKSVDRDYRRSHNSALNFLTQQVTSPIFATLDSDIEFLGPNWIEPFLLPMLLDPSVGCVGSDEEIISFDIGPFSGHTTFRIHPCLALWRTKYVWECGANWDVDDEFDLHWPIIQKSLIENQPYRVQLGDTGYKVTKTLKENNYKVVSLPSEDFFRSCRHFYGSTVNKVYYNEGWENWKRDVRNDPRTKKLGEFCDMTEQYGKFSVTILDKSKKYWADKNPQLPKQPEVPLVFVD